MLADLQAACAVSTVTSLAQLKTFLMVRASSSSSVDACSTAISDSTAWTPGLAHSINVSDIWPQTVPSSPACPCTLRVTSLRWSRASVECFGEATLIQMHFKLSN